VLLVGSGAGLPAAHDPQLISVCYALVSLFLSRLFLRHLASKQSMAVGSVMVAVSGVALFVFILCG
jgi:hypothetical protein